VAFYVVYIQEAHPSNAWQIENNVKDQVVYAEPTSIDERSNLAGICLTKLKINIPAILDDMGNPTERAYTGWPDRLYLVDREGRIAFKSPPGPCGFQPGELERALRQIAPQAPASN